MTTIKIADMVSRETGHEIRYRRDEWGGSYCYYVDDSDASGGGYFPLYLPADDAPAKMRMCGDKATIDDVRQAVRYTLNC